MILRRHGAKADIARRQGRMVIVGRGHGDSVDQRARGDWPFSDGGVGAGDDIPSAGRDLLFNAGTGQAESDRDQFGIT
jgi:hypothetical protein